MRRAVASLALAGAVVSLGAAAAAGSPAASARLAAGALDGSAGPDLTITLTQNGTPVTQIPPGAYTITVHDLGTLHNFHLTGPGVNESTTFPFVGDTTFNVNLATSSSYHFQCDLHAAFGMFGDFTTTARAAVKLVSFTATRSKPGVLVRWRTGSEVDALGFNVLREKAGKRIRVNRALVPAGVAANAVRGAAYTYRDRAAPRTAALRYWLEEVGANGGRTLYGPVRPAVSR